MTTDEQGMVKASLERWWLEWRWGVSLFFFNIQVKLPGFNDMWGEEQEETEISSQVSGLDDRYHSTNLNKEYTGKLRESRLL